MSEPVHPYRSIKGFFFFIGHLVLILFFAFLAREAWHGYQYEKLNALFSKEAHPVPIVVDDITQEKITWKDYIGNSKYIHFNYNNKPYSIRYVQDSGWVGPGTKVVLLYHEGRDEFRQNKLKTSRQPIYKTSKLVDFTVLSLFTDANIWLFCFVIFSIILVLFIGGVLANLTGFSIISRFVETLVSIMFVAGALYLTYNAYNYYKYAKQVHANTVTLKVPMLDKSQKQLGNTYRTDDIEFFYFYTAVVRYNNEDRIIPISEKEYDNVNKGDELDVLYNANMDEMTSQNFSPSYSDAVFAAVVWFLLIFWAAQKFGRWRLKK